MSNHKVYGVFIMTHGRPHKQLTYATLRRLNYTGPIKFVVDDEDPTVEKLKEKFGEYLMKHCRVYHKKHYCPYLKDAGFCVEGCEGC